MNRQTASIFFPSRLGNHFSRAGLHSVGDKIVATIICLECNSRWEEEFKIGDVVGDTICCPNCGIKEVVVTQLP